MQHAIRIEPCCVWMWQADGAGQRAPLDAFEHLTLDASLSRGCPLTTGCEPPPFALASSLPSEYGLTIHFFVGAGKGQTAYDAETK